MSNYLHQKIWLGLQRLGAAMASKDDEVRLARGAAVFDDCTSTSEENVNEDDMKGKIVSAAAPSCQLTFAALRSIIGQISSALGRLALRRNRMRSSF